MGAAAGRKWDPRTREIALIHMAKAHFGWDEELYRDILEDVGGARSAKDLTPLGRAKVLGHFERLGWHRQGRPAAKPRRRYQRGPTAAVDRAPMISKIDAMLYEAGRDRTYAVAILKQMFGQGAPERLEWATPAQLHKVVAALVYDQRRRTARR